jgi:hypothetical protein
MTLTVKPQLCTDSLSRKSGSRRSGLIVILDFCTPCNVRQTTGERMGEPDPVAPAGAGAVVAKQRTKNPRVHLSCLHLFVPLSSVNHADKHDQRVASGAGTEPTYPSPEANSLP